MSSLYFAVILMLEKLVLLPILKKCGAFKHIYVLFLVIISFVIFNAADMAEAFAYIGGMFGAGGIPAVTTEAIYYLQSNMIVLLIAIIGATPIGKSLVNKLEISPKGEAIVGVLEPILLMFLMVLCTAYLVDGSFNPFLYFRF